MKRRLSRSRMRGPGVLWIIVLLLFMLGTSVAVADDTETTGNVQDLLEDASTGGTVGLYLKEVDGPVHASLNESFVFEPASAIKALIHYHAMRQVQDGTVIGGSPVTLSRQIQFPMNQNGSCPDVSGPTGTGTLQNGLGQMMGPSDNRWTQAMRDFFGDANIDSTRQALGMNDTVLQHLIGCGGDAQDNPNQLTLVDAGKLYEAVATGFLDQPTRNTAYSLMTSGGNGFNDVIDEEALNTDLSNSGVNDFKNLRQSAVKTGAYTFEFAEDPTQEYRSIAGWARLPFKAPDCSIAPREFVHGAFIDNATAVSSTFTWRDYIREMFREQVRSALQTWVDCESDLEVVSTDVVNAPDEILVGDPVEVALDKVVTNNGPSSPMDAQVSASAAASAGMTVTPDPGNPGVIPALGLGEQRSLTETFTLTCDAPGEQTVTFTNTISPLNANVYDPITGNNSAVAEASVECVVPVAINIKPGSDPNAVNLRSGRAQVPLAVLTTTAGEYGLPLAFDATTVDPLSVSFGTDENLFDTTATGSSERHQRGHIEDAFELDEQTQDGDDDMVLHFPVQNSGLESSDSEACVKGEYSDGNDTFTFFGCDSIATRPGN